VNVTWQVHEAKNRFSELMDRAVSDGPQVVTRHGRAVVRVVAVDGSAAPQDDGFAAFLLGAPKVPGFSVPSRSSTKPPPVLGDYLR
jgi:antitoxin Phd